MLAAEAGFLANFSDRIGSNFPRQGDVFAVSVEASFTDFKSVGGFARLLDWFALDPHFRKDQQADLNFDEQTTLS